MNTERHDPRFRNGLLGIAATLSGSVVVAWGLAALMLEAVTFPDTRKKAPKNARTTNVASFPWRDLLANSRRSAAANILPVYLAISRQAGANACEAR